MDHWRLRRRAYILWRVLVGQRVANGTSQALVHDRPYNSDLCVKCVINDHGLCATRDQCINVDTRVDRA
ncbi:MAG TPA: hypothetical protein VNH82_07730 [Candidatus Dormibacteraeota bacterium]|nr:hypothetical protein [Candidatus Dormibacteraeota bacterium]